MNKTIIVSNRLPLHISVDKNELKVTPSVGGLATGMKSVHSEGNGIWIGWSGINQDEISSELSSKVDQEIRKEKCVSVPLSKQDIEEYYEGFSNRTLWPLFHYFMEYTRFESQEWETYKRVNQKFADVVLENLNDGDTVWVHDYQLLLLPQLIKDKKPFVIGSSASGTKVIGISYDRKTEIPIGVSCRTCDRLDCSQRAFPPLHKKFDVDINSRGVSIYVTE